MSIASASLISKGLEKNSLHIRDNRDAKIHLDEIEAVSQQRRNKEDGPVVVISYWSAQASHCMGVRARQ